MTTATNFEVTQVTHFQRTKKVTRVTYSNHSSHSRNFSALEDLQSDRHRIVKSYLTERRSDITQNKIELVFAEWTLVGQQNAEAHVKKLCQLYFFTTQNRT